VNLKDALVFLAFGKDKEKGTYDGSAQLLGVLLSGGKIRACACGLDASGGVLDKLLVFAETGVIGGRTAA
jgi:hypothetical protein